jgi:hypothetical protein
MANQKYIFNRNETVPNTGAGKVSYYICDTDAGKPSSGLNVGDLAWATDTYTLYTAISTTAWTPKSVYLSAQTADIAATVITTTAGIWRVSVYHVCDGGTGGLPPTPGSLSTTIRWSDGGVAKSASPAANIVLDYTNRLGADGNKVINHTTGNLTYETDFTAGDAGTTATYTLIIRADLLRTL